MGRNWEMGEPTLGLLFTGNRIDVRFAYESHDDLGSGIGLTAMSIGRSMNRGCT